VKAISAILVLFSFSAQAEPWAETQQGLAATYLTMHAADWAQTRNLARSDSGGRHGKGYEEKNPILGRKPSSGKTDAYFILTPLVGYFVLDALPQYRTGILAVANVLEVGVVAHNFTIGVKAKF
jgi:hypothetical protein